MITSKEFQNLKNQCSKLKPQYITPKQAYMAKDEYLDEVYVKLDRSLAIVLSSDGTFTFTNNLGLQQKLNKRKKSQLEDSIIKKRELEEEDESKD